MALYWNDRKYVSQYAIDPVGIKLVRNQVPIDADDGVQATMFSETTGNQVFTRPADHPGTGEYEVSFASAETSVPGPYTLTWTYSVLGSQEYVESGIEIGPAAPSYDYLPESFKDLVEQTVLRLADTIDSPGGGPNLTTYVQSKYGRGRIAELMFIALGRMNTMAQPFQTYTLDGVGGAQFPVAQWGPLLGTLTWIETLKHLIRSYTEQPTFMGSGDVSRLDRRDYTQRWRDVLMEEEAAAKSQLDVFKIASMGLGRPAVLISGGVYGRYGPTRMAGSVAARPRYWTRFY
jgi:hypothetical protein